MSNDQKIVSLSDRLASKAATANLRRVVDHTIQQLRDYATRGEIAIILREAADDLDNHTPL